MPKNKDQTVLLLMMVVSLSSCGQEKWQDYHFRKPADLDTVGARIGQHYAYKLNRLQQAYEVIN